MERSLSLNGQMECTVKTNVYVDGFNLYYRALKDTPFRWLDLRKLSEVLFPQDTINQVCYFTRIARCTAERPVPTSASASIPEGASYSAEP